MTTEPTGYPPTGPEQLDMKSRLIYFLIMQGLGVVVLAAWLYIEHIDNREQRRQTALCNQEMIEIYQTQNQQLITILADLRDYIKTQPEPSPTQKRVRK